MKQLHERDDEFERVLRADAKRAWRAAPPGLTSAVMWQVQSRAAATRAAGRISPRWYRSALAAGVALGATLIAALMLMHTAEPDRATTGPMATGEMKAGGQVGGQPVDDAAAGPVAMLASLQRTPDEVGMVIRGAMEREVHLLLEDIWNEPRRFIAHLPLQGRLDHESDQVR
jgi:hypothetical protein